MCYSKPTVYAYVPNFVLISLLCCPVESKNPQFLPIFAIFWTSALSVVGNWQQSDKVEHGCPTTNLPVPKDIEIVSVLHCRHGEIGRTISDVQKHDELECGPMPNLMVALPNIGGALCSTPQSLADAHY